MKTLMIFLAALLAIPAFAVPDTTTINGTIYLPGQDPPVAVTQGTVTAALSTAGQVGSDLVSGRVVATISGAGAVSIALVPNDTIVPANTYYTVSFAVQLPTPMSWTEKWSVVSTPDPIAIGSVTRLDVPPGPAPPVSRIQDEGTNQSRRPNLNFAGAGVSCSDDAGGSRTTCTIPGGGPGGGSPGGSDQDVQVNSSSSFGNAPGFKANTTTGAIRTKILNGVRQMDGYATGGDGLTLGTCWTGFEVALDSNPKKINAPAGIYCWNTPKTVTPASSNDREARFELSGAGRGATVFIMGTTGALNIDGSSTTGAYGISLHDFTVGLASDLWYGNGVFKITRANQFEVSNVTMLGGSVFGSTLAFNLYAGYLLNLDTSYTGSVRNVSTYGRYVYMFEKDDAAIASEDDTIHFDNCFTKGPLMGIIRAHTSGVHNFLFTNLKYQTNIELGADTNQYDATTLNGSSTAGATSIVVTDSSSFQVDDPVLLDVGNLLELNKISAVPDGTHVTVSHATRFTHATATQLLHGGIGIGLSGSSRMMTFKNAMFEQCASGVMLDATYALDMQDVISTCKEVVQVVGPSSTGGTTGLWHGMFKNVELSFNGSATNIYVVHVKANADSSNMREIEFDHVERNSSSDDTVVELQNDAATERNYSTWKPIGGNRVFENHISSAISSSSDIFSHWYNGVKVHNWTGGGAYTATGTVTAPTFVGALTGTASGNISLDNTAQTITGNKQITVSTGTWPSFIRQTPASTSSTLDFWANSTIRSLSIGYGVNAAYRVFKVWDPITPFTAEHAYLTRNGEWFVWDGSAAVQLLAYTQNTPFAGNNTHAGTETFNGAVDINAASTVDAVLTYSVAPVLNAGATFAGSTTITKVSGTSNGTTATTESTAPNNTFPSAAVPAAFVDNTNYAIPTSVSSDTGKQYLLTIDPGGNCGSTDPTGTGTCTTSGVSSGTAFPGSPANGDFFAITDDSSVGACDSAAGGSTTVCMYRSGAWIPVYCSAANGTDTLGECPGTGTCTNAKSDGTCTWQYIGSAHAGTATANDYHFLPTTTGYDSDGLNGNDAEFVWQRGYNYNGSARQDTTDYAMFQQFTWGWSDTGGVRRGEWFVQHITPRGFLWSPWSFNFNNLSTETPTADFTFKVSPFVIGFQSNTDGTAFGPGGVVGKGRLEAHGGDVYTDSCFRLDGSTIDGYATRICAAANLSVDPYSVYIPTVVDNSRFVMNAQSATSGPAAWAQNGVSCDTACTNIGQSNCADYIPMDGTNTPNADCSFATGTRICECY